MAIRRTSPGFTIVELLVVIVTIAILAMITIVVYRGVQNRAYDSTVQADLRNAFEKLQLNQADNNNTYPLTSDTTTLQTIFVATKTSYDTTTNAYLYCRSDTDGALIARSKSKTGYYYSSKGEGTIASGSWTGTGATTCPLAGILTTDAGYSFVWYHTLASGWTW